MVHKENRQGAKVARIKTLYGTLPGRQNAREFRVNRKKNRAALMDFFLCDIFATRRLCVSAFVGVFKGETDK